MVISRMSSEPSSSSHAITPDKASWAPERARLESAYTRRDAQARDQRAWSPIRPEAHWLAFSIQRFLFSALAAHGWTAATINRCRILEVGCGTGRVLRWLYDAGAVSLWGCEWLGERAKQAAQSTPFARIIQANIGALPLKSASVDCAVQVTTFSSCLDESLRRAAAAELLRVVTADGCIVWCDFRPMLGEAAYVHGIGTQELAVLFSGAHVDIRPFGANPLWLGRITSLVNQGVVRLLTGARRPVTRLPLTAAALMERCPWTTTYLGAVIRKQSRS